MAICMCRCYDTVACLFVLLVFNGTFSTNRLYRARCMKYCVGPGGTDNNIDKPNERKNNIHTNKLPPGLCGDNLLTS